MTVGVSDFAVVLPSTQQENFTPCFGCDFENTVDMPVFHHQDEVRSTDGLWRELAGFVRFRDVAMFLKDHLRSRLDRVICQSGKARRANFDVGVSECFAQQNFCGRTAAYVADADDQNFF